jgi:ATP-dependent Lhr-like helicase
MCGEVSPMSAQATEGVDGRRRGVASGPPGRTVRRVGASGPDTLLFPWRGDRIMNTLAVILAGQGFHVGQDGLALTIGDCAPDQLVRLMRTLAAGPRPDPVWLASTVRAKAHDKYDRYLSPELMNIGYAARALNVPDARSCLAEIATPTSSSGRRAPTT